MEANDHNENPEALENGNGKLIEDSASKDSMMEMPEKHTDPFAEREGKTLVWRHVNMNLAGKANEPMRKLLDEVWGEVPAKETTAIMGPSGAGKTSLLNILAGRIRSRGNISVDADIRLNNYAMDPKKIEVRQHIAFVAQDDSLQVTATPREAIRFSAKLRLSRSLTEEDLDKITERVVHELGLQTCADTIVGGALIKGISGGERKRTSVGVELVVKPALIYLDEPTSGLDSFSAVQLCEVLKKVANAGATVLFTIHQPSSEIFNSFDRLILLNKGKVMYQGLVKEVPAYFAARDHPNPTNYNPADWAMQVAQSMTMEELSKAGFFQIDERNLDEPFYAGINGKDALGITISKSNDKDGVDAPPPGMITQVNMVFARELVHLYRNKAALGMRFGITAGMSILIGIIFNKVGESDPNDPSNLQSRFGAIVMALMMSMFGTAQPSLLAFPDERPVFLREYSTNHYNVLPYFASRLSMELFITAVQILILLLIQYWMVAFQASFWMFYVTTYTLAMSSTALAVMLGCSVEVPKLGQEMLPLLFVPQLLFAGFFVTPDLMPSWLRWPRYLCSLTYAIRILLVAEFEDCSTDPMAQMKCNKLLKDVGADPDETWWNWLALVALFFFFRLGALFILKQKASKFF